VNKYFEKIDYPLGLGVFMEVKLNLGIIEIKGSFSPSDDEKKAAWELYVELVTRTSIIELKDEEGLLREALKSLLSLFDTTRGILRKYGYSISSKKDENRLSFALIAVTVLNYALRPILTKWHPILLDYEQQRPSDVSIVEYENSWEENTELRMELSKLRKQLSEFSIHLEEMIGIDSLIEIKDYLSE
jgi:hypothetical protein